MSQPGWTYRCLLPDPTNPEKACGISPPATFSEAQPPAPDGTWQPPKVTGLDPWHWMLRHLAEVHGIAARDLETATNRQEGGAGALPMRIVTSLGSGLRVMEASPAERQPGATPQFLKQFRREG